MDDFEAFSVFLKVHIRMEKRNYDSAECTRRKFENKLITSEFREFNELSLRNFSAHVQPFRYQFSPQHTQNVHDREYTRDIILPRVEIEAYSSLFVL